jgi:hypothetical protein
MSPKVTILCLVVACAAAVSNAASIHYESDQSSPSQIDKRQGFEDSYKIFLRKRNAHACMMSIVFIVLYPLGAIALHLPLQNRIRRVVTRLHAPIQILGLCMMIGATGLGIDIARNDLHYINPVQAHVAIGLLVTSIIIGLQPAMGILQHLHFRRTGKKSIFAYAHRWVGRVAIILGWTNSWLGFKLVGWELVANHSLVRNGVIMGILGGIWVSLVSIDGVRYHWLKKKKIASYTLGWGRRPVFRSVDEKGNEEGSPVN